MLEFCHGFGTEETATDYFLIYCHAFIQARLGVNWAVSLCNVLRSLHCAVCQRLPVNKVFRFQGACKCKRTYFGSHLLSFSFCRSTFGWKDYDKVYLGKFIIIILISHQYFLYHVISVVLNLLRYIQYTQRQITLCILDYACTQVSFYLFLSRYNWW